MKRILVIGSSEEGAKICEIFRSIHAEALSFLSIEPLLAEADKAAPHLVVVAHEVASRSDSTVQELRRHPAIRSIPMIVYYPSFTARPEGRAVQAGANDSLLLPVDRRELLVRSARLLQVEKRRAFKTLLTVLAGGRTLMGKSEDFSQSGLSFTTEGKLGDEENLQIQFFLPGNAGRLSLSAVVARRVPMEEGRYLYGVRFANSDPLHMARIGEFIDRGR